VVTGSAGALPVTTFQVLAVRTLDIPFSLIA
jgi:hypothetical protein